ncbi:MAG: hypothetical protein ACTSRZ_01300 [Promethearchaeota archaeon]
MPKEIEVDKNWCERVVKIVEKFNKYSKKGYLHGASESLQKLIDYMKVDSGQVRKDCAKALDKIRLFNPELFTNYTNQLIDEALAEQAEIPAYDQNEFAKYLESIIPKEEESYQPPIDLSQKPKIQQFAEIDDYIDKYDIEISPDLESEVVDENLNPSDVEEIDQSLQSFDSGGELDALMALSIEDLKLLNIERVEMKEEFMKRKCAMGDGLLKDYNGPLYQCKCGALYHETCLKIQAIYTGRCCVCDRLYRKIRKE